MRERRDAYRVFVRKPEGRRPFGRFMHGSEYNIKMDRRQWESMDGINRPQDRDKGRVVVDIVMYLRVP